MEPQSDFCVLTELETAVARKEAGDAELIAHILRDCLWVQIENGESAEGRIELFTLNANSREAVILVSSHALETYLHAVGGVKGISVPTYSNLNRSARRYTPVARRPEQQQKFRTGIRNKGESYFLVHGKVPFLFKYRWEPKVAQQNRSGGRSAHRQSGGMPLV